MSKTYAGRKGARELERDAKPGMKIYYINDHATNLAGQFEGQTYSTLFCTHRGGLKGQWMFAHGSEWHGKVFSRKGNISVEDAVLHLGGVSTTPPSHLRELASPEPDCRTEGYRGLGPGETYKGRLDPSGIEEMELHGKQAQADRDERAEKRNRGRWF